MQTEQFKREQLLRLIREEIQTKNDQDKPIQQESKLASNLISKVMENDLPIYEDELKRLLIEQAQENLKNAIIKEQKEQQLKKSIAEEELPKKKKSSANESHKNHKRVLNSSSLRSQQPQQQNILNSQDTNNNLVQQLQQNIVTLFQNFTQMIAVQVAQSVKTQLNETKKRKNKKTKPKKENHINVQTFLNKQNQPEEDFKMTFNQQQQKHRIFSKLSEQSDQQNAKQYSEEIKSSEKQQQIRPDTPSFQLQNELMQKQNQSVMHQNKFSQDLEDVYEEDFMEESQNSNLNIKQTQQPTIKVQQEKNTISEHSEDLDYPDDFVEESIGQSFNQQRSNFYNKSKVKQQSQLLVSRDYDQSGKFDISEDIEDLLY